MEGENLSSEDKNNVGNGYRRRYFREKRDRLRSRFACPAEFPRDDGAVAHPCIFAPSRGSFVRSRKVKSYVTPITAKEILILAQGPPRRKFHEHASFPRALGQIERAPLRRRREPRDYSHPINGKSSPARTCARTYAPAPYLSSSPLVTSRVCPIKYSVIPCVALQG